MRQNSFSNFVAKGKRATQNAKAGLRSIATASPNISRRDNKAGTPTTSTSQNSDDGMSSSSIDVTPRSRTDSNSTPPPSSSSNNSKPTKDSGSAGSSSEAPLDLGATPSEQKDRLLEQLLKEKQHAVEVHEGTMEHLAELAQQNADYRMSEEQARRELLEERSKYNDLLTERDTLRDSLKQMNSQYEDVKGAVVFTQVQENQRQLTDVREENKMLRSQHEALKVQIGDYKDAISKFDDDKKAWVEEKKKLAEELKAREEELVEARAKSGDIESRIGDAEKSRQNALAAFEVAQKEFSEKTETMKATYEERIKALEKESSSSLQSHENRVEALQTERNKLKKKCESLQREGRRMRKEHSKVDTKALMGLHETIARLQEELDRKTKSFENAMEALANPEVVQSTIVETVHSQPTTSSSSNGEAARLQALANQLSDTINGKEEIIRSLRFANQILGKRVLELERDDREDSRISLSTDSHEKSDGTSSSSLPSAASPAAASNGSASRRSPRLPSENPPPESLLPPLGSTQARSLSPSQFPTPTPSVPSSLRRSPMSLKRTLSEASDTQSVSSEMSDLP